MTGHVVSAPPQKHRCDPGWRTGTASDGTRYGIPPSAYNYPKGTVWECACGRAWVSRGALAWNAPGFVIWRREGWWSRRRRTRQSRRLAATR